MSALQLLQTTARVFVVVALTVGLLLGRFPHDADAVLAALVALLSATGAARDIDQARKNGG